MPPTEQHLQAVIQLQRGALVPLDRETWRRDTNRILEGVFADPGRPPVVANKLNELRTAVDNDEVECARRLIGELRTMLGGEDDPEVVFYEQLLPPPSDGAVEGAAE